MTRPETSIAGMIVKSLIGIGVFLTGLVCPNVHAQQAIQFSQYFSNHLIINPAYAGAEDALSMTLVHRNQWTGVEGAPKTTTLSGHTLFRNEHTGIGMNLFVDKINVSDKVIDCRERESSLKLPNTPIKVNPDSWLQEFSKWSKDENYVLVCEYGLQSAVVAEIMQEKGYQAYSLAGGEKGLDPKVSNP